MPTFLPGVDLAQSFYEQEVQPRLARVVHSAALLGPGSDVLDYDDVRSTDHYWGPRLQAFVDEPDVEAAKGAIEALPATHLSWPSRLRQHPLSHPCRRLDDLGVVRRQAGRRSTTRLAHP